MKHQRKIFILLLIYILFCTKIHSKDISQIVFALTSPSIIYSPTEEIPLNISVKTLGNKEVTLTKKIKFFAYLIDQKEIAGYPSEGWVVEITSLKEIVRKKEPTKAWDEKIGLNIKENLWGETQAQTTINLPTSGQYLIIAFLEDKEASLKVQVSDIALTAKMGKEKIILWCVNSKKGTPIKQSTVRIVKGNKVIYKGETNKDGIFEVDISRLKVSSPADILVEVSKRESDAYLMLKYDYPAEKEIVKVWLTTCKPFYFLEETVRFKAIFRIEDKDKLSFPPEEDVRLTIRDPKGKEIYETTQKTDKYGGFSGEFKIEPTLSLGTYTLLVTLKTHTSNINFSVIKKIIPPFKVDVLSPKKYYGAGEEIAFNIRCEYPNGLPLSTAKVKFQIKRYSPPEEVEGEVVHTAEIKTDRTGRVRVNFLPKKTETSARIRILTEVIDQMGQETLNFYDVYFIGCLPKISISSAKNIFPLGEGVPLKIFFSEQKENITPKKAKITIFKKDFEDVNITKKVEVINEHLEIAGGYLSYSFLPLMTGIYEINIELKEEKQIVKDTQDIYVIKGEEIDFLLPQLILVPEKNTFTNNLKVIVSSPFADTYGLLSAEGRDVYFHQVVSFKNTPQLINVSLKDMKEISKITLSQIHQGVPYNFEFNFQDEGFPLKVTWNKDMDINLITEKNKKVNLSALVIDEELNNIWKRKKIQEALVPPKYSTKTYPFFIPSTFEEKTKEEVKYIASYDPAIINYISYKNYSSIFLSFLLDNSYVLSLPPGEMSAFPLHQEKVIYFDASSSEGKSTTHTERIPPQKLYETKLFSPAFISPYDNFAVYLKFNNLSPRPQEATIKITAQGGEIKTPREIRTVFSPFSFNQVGWLVIPSPSSENIVLKTEINTTEKQENIEVIIPVLVPHPIKTIAEKIISEYTNASFKKVEFTIDKKKLSKVILHLFSNINSIIFGILQDMKETPTPQEIATKIMGGILLNKIARPATQASLGYPEMGTPPLQVEINNLINTLYSYQQGDGGWGICENKSDIETSTMVAHLIGVLKKQNYSQLLEKNKMLYLFLENEYHKEKDLNKKALILSSISKLDEVPIASLLDLNKQQDKLNLTSLILLGKMMHYVGLKGEANNIIQKVKTSVVITDKEYYFCEDANNTYSEKNIFLTALFLPVLAEIEETPDIQKMINYLGQSFKNNIFSSYYTTFFVFSGFLSSLKSTPTEDLQIKISLNNKLIKEIKLKSAPFKIYEITLDKKDLKEGKNNLKIEKEGESAYFYQINLREFYQKTPSTITLSRSYLNITTPAKIKIIKDKAKKTRHLLKKEVFSAYLGDLIEVSTILHIALPLQNIMVEEYIPGGVSFLSPIRDTSPFLCPLPSKLLNKISYFAPDVPAGTYTIKYHILANTPGNFYTYPPRVRILSYPETIYTGEEEGLSVEE